MNDAATFLHGAGFKSVESSEDLDLAKYGVYEEILQEALEDGIITTGERSRLDQAASSLGLDASRLHKLEEALRQAYQQEYGKQVVDTFVDATSNEIEWNEDDSEGQNDTAAHSSDQSAQKDVASLRVRAHRLELRVAELEGELEWMRAQVAVEVDLSELGHGSTSTKKTDGDSVALFACVQRDPRDVRAINNLFFSLEDGDPRQAYVAQALHYLGAANKTQRRIMRDRIGNGLMQPTAAIDRDGYNRLLCHPHGEWLAGEILSTLVPPVLLGHVAALRSAGRLPTLKAEQAVDPLTSTAQAARCVGWAAQILGMNAPPLFVDAEQPYLLRMVPALRPALQLGNKALSGRKPRELAFLAGQKLAYFRTEAFMRLLVPDIGHLQDVFLTALCIAKPQLMAAAEQIATPDKTEQQVGSAEQVGPRIVSMAQALDPLLDPADIDRLRGVVSRFEQAGGRANLQRWCNGVDQTAVRTGLLLCGDLFVAEQTLKLDAMPPARLRSTMDDLLAFVCSERYAELRGQLGL